jgi:Ca-activated chloride channel family protein
MFGRKVMTLAGGLLLWLPQRNASSRQAGTIVGTVRAVGGKSLVGAIVTVDGSAIRALTDQAGRFRLTGVPEGRQVVRARMIGFEADQREVTVTAAAETSVEFTLRELALKLDEIVVSRDVKAMRCAVPCSAPAPSGIFYSRRAPEFNTEEYRHFVDNDWQATDRKPRSTFSIDVDAASYTNIRRFVNEGRLPPADAVRTEEMINYFRYDYPDPGDDDPFAVVTELGDAPWQPTHKLALIGLQGRRMSIEQLPPNNLTFLIDVSGSMDEPAKLPLVKQAFRMLVNELRPQDRVAIVVYAGAAGMVLPSTPGDQKDRILDAIGRLEAGGSTAGGAGIELAYRVARENFLSHGNNRVILATDGDFNVGVSSEGELVRLIEARRQDGVFLTVLGFGTGNLKDSRMMQLADKGNGHYAYVDNLLEAKKVFVHELGATLYTIAKDVKIQVEFNPERVAAYRLIGYEKRLLNDADFNDDTKDAGELGAGHSVTALYEIVPAGVASNVHTGSVDPLKYQRQSRTPVGSHDWLTVKLRCKAPTGTKSKLLERVVQSETASPSNNFVFASAVAGTGMLLRSSEHKGNLTFDRVLALARKSKGADAEGYRAEFIRLVELMQAIAK